MKIAYLVNHYPAISHSFIRREILALERLGHEVLRISVRGWTDAPRGNRRSAGAGPHALTSCAAARCRCWSHSCAFWQPIPIGLRRAIALTLKVGLRAERPLPVHLIYLFEACQVALWLRSEKAQHLHVHFGTNSAEVAMLVRELGGPPWSFTAHGPEEFDKPKFIALPEKIRRARFVVAVSSFGRSQLFRNVPHVYWPKIKVVHCGLEPAFHETDASTAAGDERRLVCVGRLCEQKGQLLLIEAARLLAERGTQV